jgi:malonyl-CoA O-methyltransferase
MILNKAAIAASFGKAVESYDKVAILQRVVGEKLLMLLPNTCDDKKIVVDLGAGIGRYAVTIARKYSNITALATDIAYPMCKFGKETFANCERVIFINADADQLPFYGQAVDLVFSNLMLQWSSKLINTLAEVYRILKINGVFVFSILINGSLQELQHIWAQIDNYSHVHEFIYLENLLSYLQQVNFKVKKIEVCSYTRLFRSPYALMQELKLLGAHNIHPRRNLGLSGKQKFQQLCAGYENLRNAIGLLPLSYRVVYGYVKKTI